MKNRYKLLAEKYEHVLEARREILTPKKAYELLEPASNSMSELMKKYVEVRKEYFRTSSNPDKADQYLIALDKAFEMPFDPVFNDLMEAIDEWIFFYRFHNKIRSLDSIPNNISTAHQKSLLKGYGFNEEENQRTHLAELEAKANELLKMHHDNKKREAMRQSVLNKDNPGIEMDI